MSICQRYIQTELLTTNLRLYSTEVVMPYAFNFVRLTCILIRHRNVMKAVCQVVLLARLLETNVRQLEWIFQTFG